MKVFSSGGALSGMASGPPGRSASGSRVARQGPGGAEPSLRTARPKTDKVLSSSVGPSRTAERILQLPAGRRRGRPGPGSSIFPGRWGRSTPHGPDLAAAWEAAAAQLRIGRQKLEVRLASRKARLAEARLVARRSGLEEMPPARTRAARRTETSAPWHQYPVAKACTSQTPSPRSRTTPFGPATAWMGAVLS